jgi:predicted nucleic acid-binding protein
VLAAAVSGHAELIVTGDADLLSLRVFRNIEIVTAVAALAVIQKTESR